MRIGRSDGRCFARQNRQVACSRLQAGWLKLIGLAQVDLAQLLAVPAIGVPIPLLVAPFAARGERAAALILKGKRSELLEKSVPRG
jgi:hypothetical protein